MDTARFLAGEIPRVRARRVEKFGAYCWFVETEFANGALGHLDLTIAVRMGWHEGFQVYGEYGSVIGKTYNPVGPAEQRRGMFQRAGRPISPPRGEDGHTYRRQIEGFAGHNLHGVPQHGAGIDDGVAAVRTLVAIARSVESGDWVRRAT
ncbi:MAG: Gfo/Idh/MocA family oxidoreductase [Caldilineaceae bacterium]